MAWQDRSYYRDQTPAGRHPIWWLFYGSVPLFTVIGIRVRMHASMLIFIALGLVFSGNIGFLNSVIIYGTLFSIVLLHEFGHCLAARRVGGDAHEIIMHPLGGLALADAPRRPGAQLFRTVGGPLVNVGICLIAVVLLFLLSMGHPGVGWNPLSAHVLSLGLATRIIYYVYSVSLGILFFNLLPIYPLDGGRMVLESLWFWLGQYKATMIACLVGIPGAILMAMYGFTKIGSWWGLILVLIAGSCLIECVRTRAMLKAEGPWGFEDDGIDYSAAMWQPESPSSKSKRKKLSKRAVKKLRRLAHAEETEQKRIDDILAKVSASGMASLTWSEKRELRKATERQRDIEVPTDAEPRL
jgi:Zn-dependent protease